MIGLIIGNAMIGLAGALIAQNQSYADIGMGTGTIVIGLASVIIGEVLFGKRNVFQHMVSILLGSIAYRIIISLVLEIDFKIKIAGLIIPISVEPTDLKLFTSVIVAFALSLPVIKQLSAGKKLQNSKIQRGGWSHAKVEKLQRYLNLAQSVKSRPQSGGSGNE